MTFREPAEFVKSGLFKYTRNPMYIGFVVALFWGVFLFQAAWSSFLLVCLFWLITDRWYIRFEEQKMLAKYGDEYVEYCDATPLWIKLA